MRQAQSLAREFFQLPCVAAHTPATRDAIIIPKSNFLRAGIGKHVGLTDCPQDSSVFTASRDAIVMLATKRLRS